jgi:hypothetical protein
MNLSSKIIKISTGKSVAESAKMINDNLNLDEQGNPTGLQRQFLNLDDAKIFWNDLLSNFTNNKEYIITSHWANRYKKGGEQGWHAHAEDSEGKHFTLIFFVEFDPTVHISTRFRINDDDISGFEPEGVLEGDCLIFPADIKHCAPENTSDRIRTVSVINFSILDD